MKSPTSTLTACALAAPTDLSVKVTNPYLAALSAIREPARNRIYEESWDVKG